MKIHISIVCVFLTAILLGVGFGCKQLFDLNARVARIESRLNIYNASNISTNNPNL